MPPFDNYVPSVEDTEGPDGTPDNQQQPVPTLEKNLTDMQAELQAKLDSIKNNELKSVAQDELSEFESAKIEHQGDIEKVTLARQEFLDDIKGIQSIEKDYGTHEDFDVFVGMIEELPDGEREQVMALFADPGFTFDIEDYVWDNGMPNTETKVKFYQAFGITEGSGSSAESGRSAREANGEITALETQKQIERYSSLQTQIEGLNIDNPLIERWNSIYDIVTNPENPAYNPDAREFTNFLQLLRNEGNFSTFMDTIRSGGKAPQLTSDTTGVSNSETSAGGERVAPQQRFPASSEGNAAYATLRTLALQTDPSLQAAFDAYDSRPQTVMTAEPDSYSDVMTQGVTDGGNHTIDTSGTLTATGADGQSEIEMDLTKIPATGVMRLPGSEYSVPLEMDITPEMQQSITAYERVRLDVGPKIEKMESAIAFITELPDNAPIDMVKDRLRQDILGLTMFSELSISKAGTIEQLKNLLTPHLEGKLAEYKGDLEAAETRYETDMAHMTGAYREAMIKRHKSKLDFLKDAHDTHFDVIDQEMTDQIAREINLNKGAINLGNGIEINTDIDFAEGVFGFQDGIEGNSDKEREAFIRFVNLLSTGSPEGEQDKDGNWTGLPVDAYVRGDTPVSDTDMMEIFKRGGILNESGTVWNIQKMRENLGLTGKQEG